MKILAVDDEELALMVLENSFRKVVPDAEIKKAPNGKAAIKLAMAEDFDIACLDIEMPGMDGITLSKKLKELNPKLNIFFVTAFPNYAVEAARTYFSGYFLKPVTTEMIREGLENLRFPIQNQESEGLFVRCFGDFEVFYNGKPLHFHRSASKELFAYLVDKRGAATDTERLCETMWPDVMEPGTKERSYLRHLISDIKKTLEEIGEGDIFVHERNSFAVDAKKLRCDLYQFLDGDPHAINQFTGEYMEQYEWSLMPYTWQL